MFDWLSICFEIADYDLWEAGFRYDLWGIVNLRTGQIKAKECLKDNSTTTTITSFGEVENYSFQIKKVYTSTNETKSVRHLLLVEGSVHKNHFRGHNFSRFPFSALLKEIEFLKAAFNLDPYSTKINTLEFGINIQTEFPPFEFLKNGLLIHKTKPFDRYISRVNGGCIGFYCKKTQHSVKYYDKGLQMKLNCFILRLEISYFKMQTLNNKGIYFLSDLCSRSTLEKCSQLMLAAWESTLLYEPTIDRECPKLSASERQLLLVCESPKYWEKLNEEDSRQFSYNKSRLRRINEKVGQNRHKLIRGLIEKECDFLLNN